MWNWKSITISPKSIGWDEKCRCSFHYKIMSKLNLDPIWSPESVIFFNSTKIITLFIPERVITVKFEFRQIITDWILNFFPAFKRDDGMIKVTAKPCTVFSTCSFSFHLTVPSSRFVHRPLGWRFVQRASEGAGPQPASREEAPLLSRREAALLLLWALRQQGAVSHQVSRPQSIHVSRRGTGRWFAQNGELPALCGLEVNS